MKYWTLKERQSAKVTVNVNYRMAGVRKSTYDLIIRPNKMEPEDLEKFIEILTKYGRTILEVNKNKHGKL